MVPPVTGPRSGSFAKSKATLAPAANCCGRPRKPSFAREFTPSATGASVGATSASRRESGSQQGSTPANPALIGRAALQHELAASKIPYSVFIIDDFYLVNPEYHAEVIDYLHRLLRDTDLYLKIGTIRHRTRLSKTNGIRYGVKRAPMRFRETLRAWAFSATVFLRLGRGKGGSFRSGQHAEVTSL